MTQAIRLRRDLSLPIRPAGLPVNLRLVAFEPKHAAEVHALFSAAYADGFGDVGAFEDWWSTLQADAEYDPALVFQIRHETGELLAAAQCWNAGFVKDLAVREDWRGRGLGDALLSAACVEFVQRGFTHLDLKVDPRNIHAITLYWRSRFAAAEAA
jgi:ribosomal protein S18 acetylase RimI-like enzyme